MSLPFPGIKRPGRGVDLPTPYSAKVKERVELYLWALMACYRVIFSFTRYWPGKSKFQLLRRQQMTLPGNMRHCFVCARDATTCGSRSGSCEKCFIVVRDAVCFGIHVQTLRWSALPHPVPERGKYQVSPKTSVRDYEIKRHQMTTIP